jgi:uncharacterized protein (TIGR03083 family)
MDLVALYAETQGRIIDLVSPLEPPSLATPVPATPRWTIQQVVSHLAGVCANVVDGETEGAASEAWTDRQVAAREGRALTEVLEEWRGRAPALLEMLATPGQADSSAFDILTHEHDLRGALGLAGPSDPAAILAVTSRVTGRVDHLVGKKGLPAMRLVTDECEWICGSDEVAVTGTAPSMEWFRALFGRRSAAQILTYTWAGDPKPYFGLLNLFGPLPEFDVAEAGAPVPARQG